MKERFVLKEGQVYLVSDGNGDLASRNSDGHGLYWRDTRFLSLYELRLNDTVPTLLATTGAYNFMNNLQFANAELFTSDGVRVGARTISVRRNRFIRGGLYERLGFFNYNAFPVRLTIRLALGSDFRDMFDVRGYTARANHGTIAAPRVEGGLVQLCYTGLDGVSRATEIQFTPAPSAVTLENLELTDRVEVRRLPGLSGSSDMRTEYAVTPPSAVVEFEVPLEPKKSASITIQVVPSIQGASPETEPTSGSLDDTFVAIRGSYESWAVEATEFTTDHEVLNAVIRQASQDLRLLSDAFGSGFVPSAGIPWFSVPFGRDSLITALQTLPLLPRIASGTLEFLASHQGLQVDDWRDEEPGKILHEVRMGEVATLHQIPHTPYYGSVDSTPLFLVVLGEYLRWTADWALAERLWPNARAALDWIDRFGDLDGDGYVEYRTRSESGIRNQGWKDSRGSIAHPDGRLVEPPIALAEVQGYVYAARLAAADLLERLGDPTRAADERARASGLKQRFQRDFRLPDGGFFAMALTAEKSPLAAIGSNPGHCLWSGLLSGEAGLLAARRLQQDDLESGWGLRTLSNREPTFNPMSYHNGSVWPHDTALVAAGYKRLGLDRAATRLVEQVLEAAMSFPQHRLPELYCGFARDRVYLSTPAQYPVSCSPQAWAAGSVFMMLRTLLGLEVDAERRQFRLRPRLPSWLGRLSVRRLRVGDHQVDFEVVGQGDRVTVEIGSVGGLEPSIELADDRPR